jgi:hypothetical protein
VNNTPEWITDAFVYNKLAEEEGLAKQQQLESRRVQPMGTGVVGTGAEGASAGTVAAGGADGANGTGPVPEPTVRSDRSDIKKGYEFIESNKALIADENWRDCSVALVLAKHDLPEYAEITSKLKLRAQFNVNLIEQLAYKLNPKNNARRVELNLFSGADCP